MPNGQSAETYSRLVVTWNSRKVRERRNTWSAQGCWRGDRNYRMLMIMQSCAYTHTHSWALILNTFYVIWIISQLKRSPGKCCAYWTTDSSGERLGEVAEENGTWSLKNNTKWRQQVEEGSHKPAFGCLLAWAQLSFSTPLQFRSPCLGNEATHSGLGLFTSVNLINPAACRHT